MQRRLRLAWLLRRASERPGGAASARRRSPLQHLRWIRANVQALICELEAQPPKPFPGERDREAIGQAFALLVRFWSLGVMAIGSLLPTGTGA